MISGETIECGTIRNRHWNEVGERKNGNAGATWLKSANKPLHQKFAVKRRID